MDLTRLRDEALRPAYALSLIHISAGKGHSPAAAPYDPQHTCVVVHTGGTTGSLKGVMLTDYCFNAPVSYTHLWTPSPGRCTGRATPTGA